MRSKVLSEEAAKIIGIVVLTGGRPSVMYGCEAHENLREFEALRSIG